MTNTIRHINRKLSCFYQPILLIGTLLTLSACASTATQQAQNQFTDPEFEIHDPYEDLNRKVFNFNRGADKYLIFPIVNGYRTITTKPVRIGVRNFLRNLRSPINLVNQLLQGDMQGAGDVLVRTAINSTLGIGGIIDIAAQDDIGIEYELEDFGQTLAVWGVPHGPYFVLPFIGPSSMRDYAGYIIDSTADPLRFYLSNISQEELFAAKFVADYFEIRESVKDIQIELEQGSVDYYAALRSIYYQQRAAQVKDSTSHESAVTLEIPDYEDEEDF